MIELVRTYEAECYWCGKTHTEGSVNNDNDTFIKSLKKLGWKIRCKTRTYDFCSYNCEQLYKAELRAKKSK